MDAFRSFYSPLSTGLPEDTDEDVDFAVPEERFPPSPTFGPLAFWFPPTSGPSSGHYSPLRYGNSSEGISPAVVPHKDITIPPRVPPPADRRSNSGDSKSTGVRTTWKLPKLFSGRRKSRSIGDESVPYNCDDLEEALDAWEQTVEEEELCAATVRGEERREGTGQRRQTKKDRAQARPEERRSLVHTEPDEMSPPAQRRPEKKVLRYVRASICCGSVPSL